MIQNTHLTAWQIYAPWPRRSQIEQDLRLSRGVAAIFADPLLGEYLAMRGGTVLHKAHLAPAARYSEDIDLVLVKAIDTDYAGPASAPCPDAGAGPAGRFLDRRCVAGDS